jgi:hypothetical protein
MGPALRAALAEGSRLERFRVLTETLDGLEPGNLAEAVAVYDGELSGLGDCEIGIFMDAWTRFDPLSAVEHVQRWPFMSKRKAGLEKAIQGWALRHPEEARVAVEEMMEDQPGLKMLMIENLVVGWTYSGSPGVVAFVAELPMALRSRANVAMVGAQTRRLGAAGLLSWADEVLVELEGKREFQRGFFRRVAHGAGRRDPERAASWAGRHAGSDYGADGRRIVGEHWVKRDPAATFEWLSAGAADEEGAEAIRRVLSLWLEQDRPAAEEWLDSASRATLPDPRVRSPRRRAKQCVNHPLGESAIVSGRVKDAARLCVGQRTRLTRRACWGGFEPSQLGARPLFVRKAPDLERLSQLLARRFGVAHQRQRAAQPIARRGGIGPLF